MVSLTKRKTRMKKKIKNIGRAIPLAVALGVILMAAVIAVSSAQAQPPPIKIECTFHRVDFPNKDRYSKTKVVPKDIAWLKPGDNPYGSAGIGFVVLGRGIGHLTASTDLRKLCTQLAQVASDHGANAINYQILNRGTRLSVQFLRIEDAILQRGTAGLPVLPYRHY
jgi:hypothetical protein